MTDIPLVISADGTSVDWADPLLLAQADPHARLSPATLGVAMADSNTMLASSSRSILADDWGSVSLVPSAPLDDLATYITMLLTTDRSVPDGHFGIDRFGRRGSWHEAYTGEFGCLLWLGAEENQWQNGSKLGQIQVWCAQALQTVLDEGLIKQAAQIDVGWIDNESVQIDVAVVAADGRERKLVLVLPTG